MLTRRILILVGLALAPALAIQGYNEYALRAAREANVEADTLRVAQGAADDLAELGERMGQVLSLLEQERSVREKDPARCAEYLRSVVGDLPGIALLLVADAEGPVVCNSRGTAPGVFTNAGRPYHERALSSGGLVVGDYVEGLASGRRTIHFAQPLRSASGAVAGVIAAAVDLEWIARRLTRAGLAPDAALSVIDSQGRVLVRTPNPRDWVGRQIQPDRLAVIDANVGRARDAMAWDGRRSVVAIARPDGLMHPLVVSVGRDRATLFADIDAATRRGLVLILVGAALAVAAALVASRTVVRRPVQRLLAAASAWRRGDLSTRTGLSGATEFGQLGSAFDGMAAALQRHENDLKSEIERSIALQSRQTIMLHELNHRVKNTLATVQSLARQSRHGDAGLEARILALSKTHDLLTRDEWTSASLRELLDGEFQPYRDRADRFALEGPDLALSPGYVLALGMSVHELTTNAAKYGALSTPAGRVEVTWTVARDAEGRQRLRLTWRELGGPETAEPAHRGFGTRLITSSITRELAGEVRFRFAPDGLRCDIDIPLDRPRADVFAPSHATH